MSICKIRNVRNMRKMACFNSGRLAKSHTAHDHRSHEISHAKWVSFVLPKCLQYYSFCIFDNPLLSAALNYKINGFNVTVFNSRSDIDRLIYRLFITEGYKLNYN